MSNGASTRGKPVLRAFGWLFLVPGVLIAAYFGIFTLFSVSALFAGPAGAQFALDVFWLPLILGGVLIGFGLALAFIGAAMVRAARPVDPRDLA